MINFWHSILRVSSLTMAKSFTPIILKSDTVECAAFKWWGQTGWESEGGLHDWSNYVQSVLSSSCSPPLFPLKYILCWVTLWFYNLAKIATLEGYLYTSCSDRRHEGALLRLHPVLSNQNIHSSPGPILFVNKYVYLFIHFFDMPRNQPFLIKLQYMKKEIQLLLVAEIRSRSGEMEFPNGRLVSSYLDGTWQKFILINLEIKLFNKIC